MALCMGLKMETQLMGATGGFPIDLLLFGMIAAFLVLRLRSILGRRTGFERPTADPAASPSAPQSTRRSRARRRTSSGGR